MCFWLQAEDRDSQPLFRQRHYRPQRPLLSARDPGRDENIAAFWAGYTDLPGHLGKKDTAGQSQGE